MTFGRARVSTPGFCEKCSRESPGLTLDRETNRRLCGWCRTHSPMAQARARLRADCEGRRDRK